MGIPATKPAGAESARRAQPPPQQQVRSNQSNQANQATTRQQNATRPEQTQSSVRDQYYKDSFQAAPASARPATTAAAAPAQKPQWDPNSRADPNKVGAVINAEPKDWPSVDQLNQAGVKAVRVTVRASGESPNYTTGETGNSGEWSTKLAQYRAAGIDTTVNVPSEAIKQQMPEIPANLWDKNRDPGGPTGNDPTYRAIPFTREGTRLDPVDDQGNPKPWSEAQAQAARDWYVKFDDWNKSSYQPQLKEIQNELGPNVDRFEIWNEPDEPRNWQHKADEHWPDDQYKPAMPPGAFGSLLQESNATLKNGLPEGWKTPSLVSGGVDSGDVGYLKNAAKATGGTLYADEIGVHPYTKAPTDAAEQDPVKGNGHDGPWTGDLQSIRDEYFNELGKPIQYTEVGDARSGNELYIEEAAAAVSRTKNIQHGYFFWQDPYDGPFGLNRTFKNDDGSLQRNPDGSLKMEPRESLVHLTQMTHQPDTVPVPPEI